MIVRVHILGLALMFFSGAAIAAGGGSIVLQEPEIDLGDRPSLQRGATLFVNYCLSCHGATFMRYNRMARDIGITEQQLKDNLLFTADKVGEPMSIAMRAEDAASWFGSAPPDLSVIARSRGPSWLYTYLISFYEDENRPFGVNNLVFPDVAMPHVLAGLQGIQMLKSSAEKSGDGSGGAAHAGPQRVGKLLELRQAGSMNPAEFRRSMRDLVTFLVYLGEPAKLDRYRIGFWVLVFLAVFYLLTRMLYKEYWKDVH